MKYLWHSTAEVLGSLALYRNCNNEASNIKCGTSERVADYLLSFSEHILNGLMAEQRSKEAPTIFQIKPFLRWCAQTHTSLLDKFFTNTILFNCFNYLKRAVKIHTRLQYTIV